MSKSKKKLSGEGWTFIPADKGQEDKATGLSASPGNQQISLQQEKRAKGKLVTLALGFVLTEKDLKALAKKIKQKTGSGGSAKGDTIEIQGEHRDTVREILLKDGYKVK